MYVCGPKVQVCVCERVRVPRSEAERHISSEITMKRHAAYLDDKQHGRDLSATKQIRQKDRGRQRTETEREIEGESCEERWLACKMKGK